MDASVKVRRLAAWSIPVALGVMGLKYVAYALTGSVALYSDALRSIVNVIAAFGAWWAISVSYKPADENHPFGHHKAEYISAVVEGVLITIAALLIAKKHGRPCKRRMRLKSRGWVLQSIPLRQP